MASSKNETTIASKFALSEQELRYLYKSLSFLLRYPDLDLQSQLPLLKRELDSFTSGNLKIEFEAFFESISTIQPVDLETLYVQTFDFNKSTTLYLSYETYGEERERGKILLQIKEFFEKSGFELKVEELSDYLPLILEFLSEANKDNSISLMNVIQKNFSAYLIKMSEELDSRNHVYSPLIRLVITLFDLNESVNGG